MNAHASGRFRAAILSDVIADDATVSVTRQKAATANAGTLGKFYFNGIYFGECTSASPLLKIIIDKLHNLLASQSYRHSIRSVQGLRLLRLH